MRYAIGVAALVLLATLVQADASGQVPFFDPCAGVVVEDSEPGAVSAVTFTWGVGVGDNCISEPAIDDRDQYAIDSLVQFIPPEWGVKADADIPDGAVVGDIAAQFTLGLLNNPCTNALAVSFTLYEATTDVGNPIDALPPGTIDRMKPLRLDADTNGVPDGAESFPSFLRESFPDEALEQLRARYIGVAQVPILNNLTMVINLLVFEPGTDFPDLKLHPDAGFPMRAVTQDPSSPASFEDFINDSCSPFRAQMTLDGPLANPAAGFYAFATLLAPAPDADGDGFENALDTCALTPNVGNPRQSPDPGDAERDGVDEACDPTPGSSPGCPAIPFGLCGKDEDRDGWLNTIDNCAIVANADQADRDRDAIGDACDPNPDAVDGETSFKCIESLITVGSAGVDYTTSCESILNPPVLDCSCELITPSPTPGQSPTPRSLPNTGGRP